MILFYSLVSKVGIKRNGFAHLVPNGIFVRPKIMFAAFRFFHINDFMALPLYYYLRLYRVAFFLPE